ncbi:MAG: hypothetical protein A2174_02210 [Candidatus Portnoybacteria bacterium RBG_13_41_18]|uniref:Uncharacterized protein n=1 Tax=Candidatus Portnoybacteria bacterium RBG_13_41_18 TaxID=1801991 RepID=A0A1G2FAC3_9BACT|nr:MAG: hypothetical protein A2174_02210 [Candidatus Portnoybacteria bacterium RBG_13_41_18]
MDIKVGPYSKIRVESGGGGITTISSPDDFKLEIGEISNNHAGSKIAGVRVSAVQNLLFGARFVPGTGPDMEITFERDFLTGKFFRVFLHVWADGASFNYYLNERGGWVYRPNAEAPAPTDALKIKLPTHKDLSKMHSK